MWLQSLLPTVCVKNYDVGLVDLHQKSTMKLCLSYKSLLNDLDKVTVSHCCLCLRYSREM